MRRFTLAAVAVSAAEARAARAAYPALRKSLTVPDDYVLPDGTPSSNSFPPPAAVSVARFSLR